MKNQYIHSHTSMKHRRRELRKNATSQEKVLWHYLRNSNLGFKFQRQHSIGIYIADFYCASKKLIIELDGVQHTGTYEYDIERTLFLEDLGFTTLRFWNREIDYNIKDVIKSIQEILNNSPSRFERGLGGVE